MMISFSLYFFNDLKDLLTTLFLVVRPLTRYHSLDKNLKHAKIVPFFSI